MKLIFVCARKTGLSMFFPRRVKPSWGFLLSIAWSMHPLSFRRFGNDDMQRRDGEKR